MSRFRVLMILTGLLASAAAANAQSLSGAALLSMQDAGQTTPAVETGVTLPSPYYLKHAPQYFPPSPQYPLPKELNSLEEAAKAYYDNPKTDERAWLVQLVDETIAACQRLRALCQAPAKPEFHAAPPERSRYEGTGYPKAAFDVPVDCCRAACGVKPAVGCVIGVAGACKGISSPAHGVCTGSIMLGAGVNADSGIVTSCVRSDKCTTAPTGYRIYVFRFAAAPPGRQQGSTTPIIDELVRELTDWAGPDCVHSYSFSRQYVMPCHDIKPFIQYLPAPPKGVVAPALCCCGKACKCGDTCPSKAPQVQVQPIVPPGYGVPQPTWTLPVMPPQVPGVPYPPQAWTPQPAPMMPAVPMSMPMPAKKHAHFVTPDFDGHCERITHRGDSVILEGNVILLCKKHAQPIRIEGERVTVNMKDGSYTVDANIHHTPAGTKMRTVIEMQPRYELRSFTPAVPHMPHADVYYPPAERIIQVLPVPPLEHGPSERPR